MDNMYVGVEETYGISEGVIDAAVDWLRRAGPEVSFPDAVKYASSVEGTDTGDLVLLMSDLL